jgi:hypothetical protein
MTGRPGARSFGAMNSTTPFLVAGGAATAVSGLVVQAAVQPMTTVSDDLWSYPWTSSSLVAVSVLWAGLHVLVAIGLLSLPRSSRGPLIAITGTALLFVAELASIPIADARMADTSAVIVGAMFGLGTVLSGIGLLLTGVRERSTTLKVAGVCTIAIIGFGAFNAIAAGVALYGLCLFAVGLSLQPRLQQQPA